jgi:hypothetical protein
MREYASNARQVPNVLTAKAAQSHPNCRPSERITTISGSTWFGFDEDEAYCEREEGAPDFDASKQPSPPCRKIAFANLGAFSEHHRHGITRRIK